MNNPVLELDILKQTSPHSYCQSLKRKKVNTFGIKLSFLKEMYINHHLARHRFKEKSQIIRYHLEYVLYYLFICKN